MAGGPRMPGLLAIALQGAALDAVVPVDETPQT
jgi:hypothetical protein